ncbi:MAG: ATP-dependent endonuclease, partial [Halobacteriovoraceae bacterium]|nr:ATP-dependent endonuclease [Halobacteriovoraceae bacterium]
TLKENYLRDGKLKIKRTFHLNEKGKVEDAKNFTLKARCSNWESPKKDDWEEKHYGGIGLDTVFQSLLPTPVFIKAMPTEAEAEDIINRILSDKATKALKDKEMEELKNAQDKIKELQDKIYNQDAIENYKKHVNNHYSDLFPDLQIDIEDKDKIAWTENKLGKKFSIKFNSKLKLQKNQSVPNSFNCIGHGALRTAIFTLLLMKDIAEEFERQDSRKDYLVLFEEPELFLHPRLIKDLREMIYKVSEDDMPYQVLCASHSPQMIDISKSKSSLIRMTNSGGNFNIFQIDDEFLAEAKEISKKELKQEMYEVLRFNPYICESFYSDEVVLVEGPTEEIILRGYLSEMKTGKDLFIVNCGTVNNIPFYQKVFNKFNIKYNVLCDTDSSEITGHDYDNYPILNEGIQKSIYTLIRVHKDKDKESVGKFFVNFPTFEPAHNEKNIPNHLRFNPNSYLSSDGKPFNANLYWKNVLSPNLLDEDILKVPILNFIDDILKS